MKTIPTTLLAACCLFLTSFAFAQSAPPPVYYGPYELPSVSQFEGEWTRSDGTYKMQVTTEEGELKAQYFNPEPIKVESTSVTESEDGSLLIQVILRDEGYPGSTYQLQYLPQYRVLVGSYVIPGQAPAEVYFTQ